MGLPTRYPPSGEPLQRIYDRSRDDGLKPTGMRYDECCRRRRGAVPARAIPVVGDADRAVMDRLQWPSQHGLLQCDVRPRHRRIMAPARDRARLHEGTPRLDLQRRMPCAVFTRDSPRRSRAGFDPAGRRRRKTAAYLRGIAPRHRGLVVRHLGKHDHSYRHDGTKDGAVSVRYSRPRRGAGERPFDHRPARGHRPKDHDARQIARKVRGKCSSRETRANTDIEATGSRPAAVTVLSGVTRYLLSNSPPRPYMPCNPAMKAPLHGPA